MTPQVKAAKLVYPEGLTTKEFAAVVRKSVSTIERWRRNGTLIPVRIVATGEVSVHLYGPDDVKKGKALSKSLRPGRKNK